MNDHVLAKTSLKISNKAMNGLENRERKSKNIIYCHTVFPPRFPDLRWPHCTPYRLLKKVLSIFVTLFVPPFQTYEVMLQPIKTDVFPLSIICHHCHMKNIFNVIIHIYP